MTHRLTDDFEARPIGRGPLSAALIGATLLPFFVPGLFGALPSLTVLCGMVAFVAYRRPELSRPKWFILAALPLLLWLVFLVGSLTFGNNG